MLMCFAQTMLMCLLNENWTIQIAMQIINSRDYQMIGDDAI